MIASWDGRSHSLCHSLQFKRKCTGLSVSNLLSWPFSIECLVFSLAILEIPLLEVFFRGVALSVNFLWDMLGTMSLYIVCFEFSHLLIHLLMESILVPADITDWHSENMWILSFGGEMLSLAYSVAILLLDLMYFTALAIFIGVLFRLAF